MKKLLIFTDLDGTLLDHEDYNWHPARPALERLERLGFPVIFNTSKTFAELVSLANEIGNIHPMVCENGNLAAIPEGYFEAGQRAINHYTPHLFGIKYQQILDILNQLRTTFSYRFCGFNDLGVVGVMAQTGLGSDKASRACQRLCSEPILWLDDESELSAFGLELQKQGLSLTRGGRFYHVMKPLNKAIAMNWLLEQYQQLEPDTEWITVALGDSFNDVQMLEAAHIPVLIHNPHGTAPNLSHLRQLISPSHTGPRGWNEAINQIIDTQL